MHSDSMVWDKEAGALNHSITHLLLHLTVPSRKICRRSIGFFMQMSNNMLKSTKHYGLDLEAAPW